MGFRIAVFPGPHHASLPEAQCIRGCMQPSARTLPRCKREVDSLPRCCSATAQALTAAPLFAVCRRPSPRLPAIVSRAEWAETETGTPCRASQPHKHSIVQVRSCALAVAPSIDTVSWLNPAFNLAHSKLLACWWLEMRLTQWKPPVSTAAAAAGAGAATAAAAVPCKVVCPEQRFCCDHKVTGGASVPSK